MFCVLFIILKNIPVKIPNRAVDGIFIMCSFIGGLTEKRVKPIFLIRMSVIGLAVFLMIWETRSRYIINFMPLFVLMSADGLRYLCCWLCKIKSCIVSKLTKHNTKICRI
ncbi:MAG: hypothetical protein LUE12_08050 [Ruminococcus sp.]|nr:hypothetical protein [Ruminococcus sp.]